MLFKNLAMAFCRRIGDPAESAEILAASAQSQPPKLRTQPASAKTAVRSVKPQYSEGVWSIHR